jgi:hypothetical protein
MLNRTLLLSLTVASTMIFTGCTNLAPKVHLNAYRLENPEVVSKPLKVNLAAGIVTVNQLTVQVTDEENYASYTLDSMVNLGVSLAKGLQFSLSDSPGSYRLSAKYQFYGNHADLATKGNFSQAFSLGYANTDTSDEEPLPGNDRYSGGEYLNWELATHTIDVAWILGYRITHNFMVYGGPFYGYSVAKGTRFKNSAAFEKALDLSGHMAGANVAFEYRFDMGLALSLEALTYNNRWEGGEYSFSDATLNFKIDYQF